jgi:hypothetical protein
MFKLVGCKNLDSAQSVGFFYLFNFVVFVHCFDYLFVLLIISFLISLIFTSETKPQIAGLFLYFILGGGY